MSRTVEWSQWQARRMAAVGAQVRVSQRSGSRRGDDGARVRADDGARVRADDDVAIITRMVLLEVERRRDERRLVRLGPREYELRTRRADQTR